MLPLSHDEVVHGKGSLLGRIPGDDWQKFATLRTYYAFMWAHPGKKLLFMGQEFGQRQEWNFAWQLDWHLLEQPFHKGVQACVRDLNALYKREPALHASDCEPAGFRWIVVDDNQQSVVAWVRLGRNSDPAIVVVCNFTPVPRHDYRIGVPHAGDWEEVLNTDGTQYGGSGVGNPETIAADDQSSHGFPASLVLTLPPLGTLYLRRAAA